MQGVIEIPLIAFDGKQVGKVLIDKNGQLKIEMKTWTRPSDVLVFLKNITTNMDQAVNLQRMSQGKKPS